MLSQAPLATCRQKIRLKVSFRSQDFAAVRKCEYRTYSLRNCKLLVWTHGPLTPDEEQPGRTFGYCKPNLTAA